MALPLVLARSFREAHAFAKERLDLRVGHYRVVNDAGTIKGVRNTQLYLVPGWDKRPDRFKMSGAMRYCKLEIVDVAAEQAKEPFVEVDGVLTPRGCADAIKNSGYPLNERTHEIALRYNRLRDLPEDRPIPKFDALMKETDFFDGVDTPPLPPEAPEPVATCVDCGLTPCDAECASNTLETVPTVVSPEAEALAAEAPKRRRRSRCKQCEQLHYKDESCPEIEG